MNVAKLQALRCTKTLTCLDFMSSRPQECKVQDRQKTALNQSEQQQVKVRCWR
jgi:hypothetical protein